MCGAPGLTGALRFNRIFSRTGPLAGRGRGIYQKPAGYAP